MALGIHGATPRNAARGLVPTLVFVVCEGGTVSQASLTVGPQDKCWGPWPCFVLKSSSKAQPTLCRPSLPLLLA